MDRRDFLKVGVASLAVPLVGSAKAADISDLVASRPFTKSQRDELDKKLGLRRPIRIADAYKLIDGRYMLVDAKTIKHGDKFFMIGLDKHEGELWRVSYVEADGDWFCLPRDEPGGGVAYRKKHAFLEHGVVHIKDFFPVNYKRLYYPCISQTFIRDNDRNFKRHPFNACYPSDAFNVTIHDNELL